MIENVFVDSSLIDAVVNDETPSYDLFDIEPQPYLGLVLKNGKQSILAVVDKDLKVRRIPTKFEGLVIQPRSIEQYFCLYYMLNEDIKMIAVSGGAGVGKTLLSAAVAARLLKKSKATTNIVLTKSISEVGKYRLGSFPGFADEKFNPYTESFKMAFKKVRVDIEDYIDPLEDRKPKGSISYIPINLMRGMSLDNTLLIVDESQNLSTIELRTTLTRVGENSRVFVLGDLNQSDESHNGEAFKKLINSPLVADSGLCATIQLEQNERSPISFLMDRVFSQ